MNCAQGLEAVAMDGCGNPSNGGNTDTSKSGVEWQVGWFAVFLLPATSSCSLVVGKLRRSRRGIS